MDFVVRGLERFALLHMANDGSFIDPVYKIKRNRVSAEFGNLFLAQGLSSNAKLTYDYLLKTQNRNGSWNEIHPMSEEEAAITTAMVGKALLKGYCALNFKPYLSAAIKGAEFILSREIGYGQFLKCASHYENCLNVNATCAAFLKRVYDITKQTKYNSARRRAIINTVKYQFKNGAFPYCSQELTFPFEYHRYVQDIHYQAVTLFYLLLALNDDEKSEFLFETNILRGIKWLGGAVKSDGTFDWSKSDLAFAQKLIGAYGFAAAAFKLASLDRQYKVCIHKLKSLQLSSGSFRRYEKTGLLNCIKGLLRDLFEVRMANVYSYPFIIKLDRAFRRVYREYEAARNNPISMFYSSQIADCLAEIIFSNKQNL